MDEAIEESDGVPSRRILIVWGALTLTVIVLIVAAVLATGTAQQGPSGSMPAPPSPGTTGRPSTTAPAERDEADVEQEARLLAANFDLVTGENCREIYVTFENLSFRSRDFPSTWGPDTAVSGQFVQYAADDSEAIFVTREGVEVVFYGGKEALFTADCPLYVN